MAIKLGGACPIVSKHIVVAMFLNCKLFKIKLLKYLSILMYTRIFFRILIKELPLPNECLVAVQGICQVHHMLYYPYTIGNFCNVSSS